MATKIVKCPSCNTENTGLENFCRNCGNTLGDPFQNNQPPQQQQMQQPYNPNSGGTVPGADKKIAAGLCGILLGGFGVHKFILGYQNEGIIMLSAQVVSWVIAIATCGIGAFLPMIVGIIGLIEGIIYLTKSDEDFVQTYVTNKKPWF